MQLKNQSHGYVYKDEVKKDKIQVIAENVNLLDKKRWYEDFKGT